MAEEDDIEDEDAASGNDGDSDSEDGEGDAKKGKKDKGKSKLLLIIIIVIVLLIGSAAGAYFTGLLDPLFGEAKVEEAAGETEGISSGGVYYELPELLVNINPKGSESSFLKLKISLELMQPGDILFIEQIMPLIIDNFQVYLRELRVDDLHGAAGMYRLREELLKRVNLALTGVTPTGNQEEEAAEEGAVNTPKQIKDILFREMLVQ